MQYDETLADVCPPPPLLQPACSVYASAGSFSCSCPLPVLPYSRYCFRHARPWARMASVCVTYLLWLLGGWLGLHHFYLGRDKQALVWWCLPGGYFGLGWVRDLWRIPEYVREANR